MWRILEEGLGYIESIWGRGPRRSVLGRAGEMSVIVFLSFTEAHRSSLFSLVRGEHDLQ